MTEEQTFGRDWFSKPGDSVLSLMERRNLSARELAAALTGGMDTVRGLLDGSLQIDRKLARDLAGAVGGTTDFWLRRQANFGEALGQVVSVVCTAESEQWLERVPVPGPKAKGRLSDARRQAEIRQRLVFFNVNNLAAWMRHYGCIRSETQFRTSPTLLSDEGAVSMWLRQGELEAALVSTKRWDPDGLREKLGEIRGLSRIGHPMRFLPKLKELLAWVGVALVVVRAPTGCRASGATRMVSSDKAMILMSFRFRADDHFWFTLFHEIGHLLLHSGETFVDDEETLLDDREWEANEFARRCIIPADRQAEFERLRPNRHAVLRFSVSVGIAPGLTVGQMQHRKMIDHDRLNTLKRRWVWDEIEPALA
jgi:HTH-type transcriptional regulator / antitoxin HigA